MSSAKQQVRRQIVDGLRSRINAWEAERENILAAMARRDNKATRMQQLDALIAEAKAQIAKTERDDGP